MNGRGKMSYPNGKFYEGNFVDDLKDGYGVYEWDNKRYEGQWK